MISRLSALVEGPFEALPDGKVRGMCGGDGFYRMMGTALHRGFQFEPDFLNEEGNMSLTGIWGLAPCSAIMNGRWHSRFVRFATKFFA